MVGQASSLSIKNDGQDARRHQVLFLCAITFENPYMGVLCVSWRSLSDPQLFGFYPQRPARMSTTKISGLQYSLNRGLDAPIPLDTNK